MYTIRLTRIQDSSEYNEDGGARRGAHSRFGLRLGVRAGGRQDHDLYGGGHELVLESARHQPVLRGAAATRVKRTWVAPIPLWNRGLDSCEFTGRSVFSKNITTQMRERTVVPSRKSGVPSSMTREYVPGGVSTGSLVRGRGEE